MTLYGSLVAFMECIDKALESNTPWRKTTATNLEHWKSEKTRTGATIDSTRSRHLSLQQIHNLIIEGYNYQRVGAHQPLRARREMAGEVAALHKIFQMLARNPRLPAEARAEPSALGKPRAGSKNQFRIRPSRRRSLLPCRRGQIWSWTRRIRKLLAAAWPLSPGFGIVLLKATPSRSKPCARRLVAAH